MSEKIQKLKELIEGSEKILVTTHNGPDPDAWTSLSIVVIALRKYLSKDVDIVVKGNEKESDLVKRYEELNNILLKSPEEEIDLSKYDLIIMTDTYSISRAVMTYSGLREDTKLVALDHHEMEADKIGRLALIFNELRSSAAEEVYTTFKELLGDEFASNEEVALLAQKGIISDTGQFMYKNVSDKTYELMADLVRVKRLDVENYILEESKIDITAIKALQIYLSSYTKIGNMAYMVLRAEEMREREITHEGRGDARQMVTSNIILKVKGVDWGFAIQESLEKDGDWSISFRAVDGTREVVKIAEKLGGGGHMYAAGARLYGKTRDEAIQIILDAAKATE